MTDKETQHNKLVDFLRTRKQAYNITFNKESQSANKVLKDLAKFCRANTSTFNPDPRIAAMLDGRREVFLRITQHLHLSVEQLLKILE